MLSIIASPSDFLTTVYAPLIFPTGPAFCVNLSRLQLMAPTTRRLVQIVNLLILQLLVMLCVQHLLWLLSQAFRELEILTAL
jgi:hypothetical protein